LSRGVKEYNAREKIIKYVKKVVRFHINSKMGSDRCTQGGGGRGGGEGKFGKV
jgi:hypothetical protein